MHTARRRTLLPNLLIIAGVMAMLTPVLWSIRADMLQRAELERVRSQAKRPPPKPSNSYAPKVMPPSEIIIPKMDLDAAVVEETQASDLNRGPMHVAGTGVPGQPGNCCIAAHKEKWFHQLRVLKIGDPVYIRADGVQYTYLVTSRQILRADRVEVMDPTPQPTITLITCTGPAYFGHGNGRLVVKGLLLPMKSLPAKKK